MTNAEAVAQRSTHSFAHKGSHRETDHNYPQIIACLNDRYRVIRCKDGLQFIIQKRDGFRIGQPRWEGRSYCVEPATVHRLVLRHCGIVDAAELEKLQRLSRGSNHNDR